MPKFVYTDTVSIYHLVRAGNTEDYASVAYANINAVITPQATGISTNTSGTYASQLYDVFISDTSLVLKTGDKLITASGISYFVSNEPFYLKNPYLNFIQLEARKVI